MFPNISDGQAVLKSPEEGQLVRPKYRKTLSPFSLRCLNFITLFRTKDKMHAIVFSRYSHCFRILGVQTKFI